MKKETVFKTADGKEYELILTIKGLKAVESDIHNSLYAIMADVSRGYMGNINLNFTESVLRHAMPDEMSIDDVDEVIENHCFEGGNLDDINMVLFDTLFNTGLFLPGKNVDEVTVKKEKATTKTEK